MLLLTVVRVVGAVVLEHGIYRFVAFPRSSVWTGNTAYLFVDKRLHIQLIKKTVQ